jgi:hypothetical protein
MIPALLRVQYAGGLFAVLTCQPVRMMKRMKNELRKCCQASQAGKPTGAVAGSAELPGKSVMNDLTAGSPRIPLAARTTRTSATRIAGTSQTSLNQRFFVVPARPGGVPINSRHGGSRRF